MPAYDYTLQPQKRYLCKRAEEYERIANSSKLRKDKAKAKIDLLKLLTFEHRSIMKLIFLTFALAFVLFLIIILMSFDSSRHVLNTTIIRLSFISAIILTLIAEKITNKYNLKERKTDMWKLNHKNKTELMLDYFETYCTQLFSHYQFKVYEKLTNHYKEELLNLNMKEDIILRFDPEGKAYQKEELSDVRRTELEGLLLKYQTERIKYEGMLEDTAKRQALAEIFPNSFEINWVKILAYSGALGILLMTFWNLPIFFSAAFQSNVATSSSELSKILNIVIPLVIGFVLPVIHVKYARYQSEKAFKIAYKTTSTPIDNKNQTAPQAADKYIEGIWDYIDYLVLKQLEIDKVDNQLK